MYALPSLSLPSPTSFHSSNSSTPLLSLSPCRSASPSPLNKHLPRTPELRLRPPAEHARHERGEIYSYAVTDKLFKSATSECWMRKRARQNDWQKTLVIRALVIAWACSSWEQMLPDGHSGSLVGFLPAPKMTGVTSTGGDLSCHFTLSICRPYLNFLL